jgi:DNA-binding CsgD family transcriptional regulator
MLDTQSLPTSRDVAANPIAQLLHLCEKLRDYSDQEISLQLQQLAFAHPEHLVHPVRLVIHTSQHIVQRGSAPVVAPPAAPPAAPVLSAREQEILALLAKGYTMPRIGEQLFISPATVNNHCARMREKLGLHGCKALSIYAMNSH